MTFSTDEVEVSLFSAWASDIAVCIFNFVQALGHLHVHHSLRLVCIAELRLLVYKSVVRDFVAPGERTLGVA